MQNGNDVGFICAVADDFSIVELAVILLGFSLGNSCGIRPDYMIDSGDKRKGICIGSNLLCRVQPTREQDLMLRVINIQDPA